MTEKERAKKLAAEHWGYVEGVILAAKYEVSDSAMKEIAYHYKTAFAHGYKHSVEDERAGMFRPSIGEPLTPAEVDAISEPCSACLDELPCGGGLREVSGFCLHHRPKVETGCKTCLLETGCMLHGAGATICSNHRPKVADQQHPRQEA